MKTVNKWIALMLVLILTLALAGEAVADDTWNISYWIPVGEDSTYYSSYEENPVILWLNKNKTFNGKTINWDFVVGSPGAQQDDWSRLMAVGDYCDIMDMSMANVTAKELYEEGMIWDITKLVEEHVPSLMAELEKSPWLKEYFYTNVDGENKILALRGIMDSPEPIFEGYCYRRDWIAKYGKNPVTGEAFTYGFTDPADDSTWFDDVVFPNGTDEPIYISDWEWMMDIFATALQDLGITDGYCFAPYYTGYLAIGDLYSGFGGGAPNWYLEDGNVINGYTSENMRAYLECLNTWYKNGWIDKRFDERTSEMFYTINSPGVFQGKVGLWQGRASTTGTQIRMEGTASADAMVFGCRQPINDLYGGDAQKNKAPNYMYQFKRYGGSVVFTDKMSEDEIIAVLDMMEYTFSEEGWKLANLGLDSEQVKDILPNSFVSKYGLEEGFYTYDEASQLYQPLIALSDTTNAATKLNRFTPKYGVVSLIDHGYSRYEQQAEDAWTYYESTAELPDSVLYGVTTDQNQEITRINASLTQFLERSVPAIIKGEGYDIWNDADWEKFVKDVVKYRADRITEYYQEAYDATH